MNNAKLVSDTEHQAIILRINAEMTAQMRKNSQLHGIEFQGVMCSATGDDQAGLSAIFMKHSLAKIAGKTFPDVHFRFENGSLLTLNADNIDALDAVWTPFRLSFFPPSA